MSQNHHHDYELLRLVDQAVHDKQPTGHPLIDRLSAAIPQADAERAAALEAALINRLSKPEQELQPMSDFTTETKRKGQPKRRRLPVRLAAALLMLGAGVLAVLNPRLSPSGLEFGRFRTGQVEPGGNMSELYLTATAQLWQATNNASRSRPPFGPPLPPEDNVEVSTFNTDDELTATAMLFVFTQEAVNLTATARAVLGLSVPTVITTPTPMPQPAIQTGRLEIPTARLVGYNQTTDFAQGMRLVLMVELPITAFTEPFSTRAAQDSTPVPPQRIETPFIATSARVVAVAGDRVTVEVTADEYPILRWFVESTGVQLLYVASQ